MSQPNSVEETVKNIFDLFLNRFDCYACQTDAFNFIKKDEKLTAEVVKRHLSHEITIGIYQLNKENKIKWICFDFDDENSQQNATKLLNYLLNKPLFKNAVLLEYTGGRGYHVWIFFKEKISATAGRALCEKILEKTSFKCEFFPKQCSLSPQSPFGSLVRLPLGLHKKYGKVSELIFPKTLNEIKPTILPKSLIYKLENSDRENNNLHSQTSFFENRLRCPAINDLLLGVKEGTRDIAAFVLARFYKSLNLTQTETHLLMSHWNTKNSPPLDSRQLEKCVKQAFQRKYTFGCSSFLEPQLKEFCLKYQNTCAIKKIKDKKSEPYSFEVIS